METKRKSIGRFFLMSLFFCLIMSMTAGPALALQERGDKDRDWHRPHKEMRTGEDHGYGHGWDRHWAHMGPVRTFNLWVYNFMVHLELFDLTPEQKDKIEKLNAGHQKAAIRAWADIRTQMVDLRQLFKTENLDLQAIETQLNQIAHSDVQAIMEGLKFYTDLMNTLTPQQKEKVKEVIGSPFMPPWEQGNVGWPKKSSRPAKTAPAPEKGGKAAGSDQSTGEQ